MKHHAASHYDIGTGQVGGEEERAK